MQNIKILLLVAYQDIIATKGKLLRECCQIVENIIPEDELFEYITAIEEKALNSENVDIITAGIYIISILMNYCPNSFLANQENEIKKLEFLDSENLKKPYINVEFGKPDNKSSNVKLLKK